MTTPALDEIRVEITGDVSGVDAAMKAAANSVRIAATAAQTNASNFATAINAMQRSSTTAASSFLTMEQALEAETLAARAALTPAVKIAEATDKHHLALGRLTRALFETTREVFGFSRVAEQGAHVVGGFALGEPLMIGVIAGIAALAFAWEHVSKAAKKATEDQDAAVKALEAIRDKQRNPVLGSIPSQITEVTNRKQEREAELAAVEKIIAIQKKGLFGVEQERLDRRSELINEIGNLQNLIDHAHDEERAKEKEHADKLAADAETAANKKLAKLKEQQQKEEAIRAAAQKLAEARAKAFNDILEATRKVGDDALKRDTARVEKEAKAYQALQEAIEAAAEAGKKMRKEYAAEWEKVFESVRQSFSKAIQDASVKSGFLREVWRSVWYDMINASATFAAKQVGAWAAMELAKNGITKKAVTQRVDHELWAATKTIAIKTWEAIKWIAIEAAKAAAAAWSALAGIPVIGPALAVGAAIATFAGVMALAKGLSGGGGSGPSGGSAASGAAAAQTANSRRSAEGGGTIIVNAMDAKSFKEFAVTNRGAIVAAFSKSAREGGLTPRTMGAG